ncbi:MAG TPA: SDR family oxidoreductase [Kofleriaceae bacterium]|jgi:NAD(P)-dependent dehydrogenase (short-subunit alcohol dehydrogenase family)
MSDLPVCVVLGVGPGNGAAFARAFAAAGYRVALLARSTELSSELERTLPGSRAFSCDAGDPASIARAFAEIRASLGEPATIIYNAGTGAFGGLDKVDVAAFESAWRVNALGAFAVAKELSPSTQALVFVGATASRRGGPNTTAFAPAKAAQRSLAESLARQLWPKGVHVGLLILDGVVDLPRTRKMLPDKPDSFFLHPDDVAAAALSLVRQPRGAWSFELEVRPFGETW